MVGVWVNQKILEVSTLTNTFTQSQIDLVPYRNFKKAILIFSVFILSSILFFTAIMYFYLSKSILSIIFTLLMFVVIYWLMHSLRKGFNGACSHIDLENKILYIFDRTFMKFRYKACKFETIKNLIFKVVYRGQGIYGFSIFAEIDNEVYELGSYLTKATADDIVEKIASFYGLNIEYLSGEDSLLNTCDSLLLNPDYKFSYTPNSYLFAGLFLSPIIIVNAIAQNYALMIMSVLLIGWYFSTFYKAKQNEKNILVTNEKE